ncbi:unnamed protein product, partial [Discosporangium mesarthrocarpum]
GGGRSTSEGEPATAGRAGAISIRGGDVTSSGGSGGLIQSRSGLRKVFCSGHGLPAKLEVVKRKPGSRAGAGAVAGALSKGPEGGGDRRALRGRYVCPLSPERRCGLMEPCSLSKRPRKPSSQQRGLDHSSHRDGGGRAVDKPKGPGKGKGRPKPDHRAGGGAVATTAGPQTSTEDAATKKAVAWACQLYIAGGLGLGGRNDPGARDRAGMAAGHGHRQPRGSDVGPGAGEAEREGAGAEAEAEAEAEAGAVEMPAAGVPVPSCLPSA